MPALTVAFCTFNRARRLERLVAALRAQQCPVDFDILAVNNNSRDDTLATLAHLQAQPGAPLRYVTEAEPGIVPARNRALQEAADSTYLVFIDDDELPHPGLLMAAYDALANEGADCVGGKVEIDFQPHGRPAWLGNDLLGFLAAVDHGPQAFWIRDASTPVWTSNIAYRLSYLQTHDLRFDARYNRQGNSATSPGGGEDHVMLARLLELQARIRYRPDMCVDHGVEIERLNRRYFVRLHYRAGLRKGLHELPAYTRTCLGVPPFLVAQSLTHSAKALLMLLALRDGWLRQAMNAAHALGLLTGYRQRHEAR